MSIVCDLTNTTIRFLRAKKLNGLISKSGKCFELIFFVFAGLFLVFFSAQKIATSMKFDDFLAGAEKNLERLIALAKTTYYSQ